MTKTIQNNDLIWEALSKQTKIRSLDMDGTKDLFTQLSKMESLELEVFLE